eukprot:TRINITY_DN9906_c0_g1_i1.p1 TRINITY_DN9906_c0_g1~~TRINITY_DN9906_c0_g1_i1.p1  ORF type:complete len:628 (-),score=199.69 TRINITY_DN9906_c0_g1_i1:586-2469(-)
MGRVTVEAPVASVPEDSTTTPVVGERLVNRVHDLTPTYVSDLVSRVASVHDTAKTKVSGLGALEDRLLAYASPLVSRYGAGVEAYSLQQLERVESTLHSARDLVNTKVIQPAHEGKAKLDDSVLRPVGDAYVTGRQVLEQQVVKRVHDVVGAVRGQVDRAQSAATQLKSVEALSNALKDRTYTLISAVDDYAHGGEQATEVDIGSDADVPSDDDVPGTEDAAPLSSRRVLAIGVGASMRLKRDTLAAVREWQSSVVSLERLSYPAQVARTRSLQLTNGVASALQAVSDISLHEWIILRSQILTLSQHAQELGSARLSSIASRLSDLASTIGIFTHRSTRVQLDGDGNPIVADDDDATAKIDADGNPVAVTLNPEERSFLLTQVRQVLSKIQEEAVSAVSRTREEAVARITDALSSARTTVNNTGVPLVIGMYCNNAYRHSQNALQAKEVLVDKLKHHPMYQAINDVVNSSVDNITAIVNRTRDQLAALSIRPPSTPSTAAQAPPASPSASTTPHEVVTPAASAAHADDAALDAAATQAAQSIREHAATALRQLVEHVDHALQQTIASPATTVGTPRTNRTRSEAPTPSPFASSSSEQGEDEDSMLDLDTGDLDNESVSQYESAGDDE